MSQVLDSKVVEMKFDNRDFEKNVSTSMSTLEKLQNKLKFGESSKAFSELDSASRKVSFDGLGSAIEKVQVKFSNMQVVFARVLMNMVDDAYNAGKRLVASLSTDQITSGWDKYAEKTTSVQTIMAATREEFAGMDNQMEIVSEQIAKLNWFTDETSYNFVDMTSNIGKFTSAGQKLGDSVKAMQGIANVAAISGQNAQAASRAMYNFSQSLGMGYVGLTDWMSIENANMATAEFKQTLIDTAVELGVIAKESVTIQNFRETLKDKWLDAEVLTEALNKYGQFSVELGEVMTQLWDDGFDLTTSEFVNFVEEFKKNKTIPEEVFETFGDKAEEVSEIIKKLGDDTYDLGFRSFKAAQEAKTFAEALDSVKDAVSTGWMNTFELIFGNYEQAKKLWTDLANELYDIFATSGEKRNELLADWSTLTEGGRQDLIDAFWTMWNAIKSIMDAISSAMEDIFPPATKEDLQALVLGFKRFAESLQLSETELDNIKRTFKGLFSILKIGKSLIDAVFGAIGNLISGLDGTGESIFSVTASWGDWLTQLADTIDKEKIFEKAINGLVNFVKNTYRTIKEYINKFLEIPVVKATLESFQKVITDIWDGIVNYFTRAGNKIGEFADKAKDIQDVGEFFKEFGGVIKSIFIDFVKTLTGIDLESSTLIEDILNNIKGFFSGIGDFASEFYTNNIASLFDGFNEQLSGFGVDTANVFDNIMNTINQFMADISASVKEFSLEDLGSILFSAFSVVMSVKVIELVNNITSITSSFKTLTKSAKELVKSFKAKNTTSMFVDISKSILMIAAAIAGLAFINKDYPIAEASDAIFRIMVTMGVMAAGIALIMGAFEKKGVDTASFASIISSIGIGVLAIAGSLAILSNMGDNVVGAAIGIGALLIALSATMTYIAKNAKTARSSAFVLAALGVSIGLIVLSIKSLAKLNPESLFGAVAATSALLLELAVAMRIMNNIKVKAGTGFALIGFSASLLVLLWSIKAIAKSDPTDIFKGITNLIPLLILIGVLCVEARIAGNNASGAGSALFKISAAILLLVGVVYIISKFKQEDIDKGVGFIYSFLLFFSVLTIVSEAAGEFADKAGKFLMRASIAILLLTGIAVAMRFVEWKDIAKGIVVVDGIGLMLAALVLALKNSGEIKLKPLITIGVVIGLLSVIIAVTSALSLGNAINSAIAIGILLTAFLASLWILEQGHGRTDLKTIISEVALLGLVMIAITGVMSIVAQMPNPDALISVAIAIGILLLAMTASLKILETHNRTAKIKMEALLGMIAMVTLLGLIMTAIGAWVNPDGLITKVVALSILLATTVAALTILSTFDPSLQISTALGLAAMVAVLLGLTLVFNNLNNLNPESLLPIAISLSVVLLALSGTLILLGIGGSLAGAALIGVLVMALVMAGVFVLLEAMAQLADQKSTLEAGIEILTLLGEGLGSFFGGIIDGFANKITENMPEYGTRLSEFADNASGFIQMLKDISGNDLEGPMLSLAGALIAFGGAELLNSLSNLMNSVFGGKSLTEKMLDLVDMYYVVADALDGAPGIDETTLNNVAKLALIADLGPKFGGVVQWWTGETKMDEVGKQMVAFAAAYLAFATTANVAPELKEHIISDMTSVMEFFDTAPKFGGIVQWFEGTTDLDTVGGQIQRFAQFYGNFVDISKEIPALKKGLLDDIGAVTEWAKKTPPVGGFVQMFTGEIQLTTFGDNLSKFMEGYKVFAGGTESVSTVRRAKLDNMLMVLEWMDKEVPDWLSDKSEKMYIVGQALSSFAQGYNQISMTSKITGVANLTGLTDMVTQIGGLVVALSQNGITGDYMEKLGRSLAVYEAGLTMLAVGIQSVNFDKMTSINEWSRSYIELMAKIQDNDIEDSAKKMSSSLVTMSDAMINDVKDTSSITAKSAGVSIIEAFVSSIHEAFLSPKSASVYTSILKVITETFTNAIDSINSTVNDHRNMLTSAGRNLIQYFLDGAESKFKTNTIIKDISDKLISSFGQKLNEFKSIGQNLISGFVEGMNSYRYRIVDASTELGKAAATALRLELDIHSPSKVAEEIGNFFGEGFINGISQYENGAFDIGGDLGTELQNGLMNSIDNVNNILNSGIDISPTITPVIDTSILENSIPDINSLFSGKSIDLAAIVGTSFDDIKRNTLDKLSSMKSSGLEGLFKDLTSKIGDLGNKMSNLEVVMDTGALVGEISSPLDSVFGSKTLHNSRGR